MCLLLIELLREDGRTDGRTYGRADGRTNGRTDGWTDGRTSKIAREIVWEHFDIWKGPTERHATSMPGRMVFAD